MTTPKIEKINGIEWQYDIWEFDVAGKKLKEVHPGNFDGKPFEGYCWEEDTESTPVKCIVYRFNNTVNNRGWIVLLNDNLEEYNTAKEEDKENWLSLIDHVAII